MSLKIIGSADEFWRLRMTRVDTTDQMDFEWREDVLYREPPAAVLRDQELWHVEAVRLDNYEAVERLASFGERDDAEIFLAQAKEDLRDMTKSQFEDTYLTLDGTDAAEGLA